MLAEGLPVEAGVWTPTACSIGGRTGPAYRPARPLPRYREADLILESLTGLDEAALRRLGVPVPG